MELKDLLETLDLGEVKDIDSFKKTFNEKFIPKSHIMEDESVKKAIGEKTGKTMGAFATLIKREFGLSSEEIEGKKWEEQFSLGIAKKKAEIEELKATAGAGGDEKLSALQAQLDKEKKANGDYKQLLETTKEAVTLKDQEIAKKDEEFNSKIKSFKIGTILDKAKANVFSTKMKDQLSIAEKMGFEASLSSLTIDLGEKDEVIVLGQDGKRLTNPNKVGAFLNLEEALEAQAIALNLAKKNNGATVDVKKLFGGQQEQPTQQQTQVTTGRKLHPNAAKGAEMASKK